MGCGWVTGRLPQCPVVALNQIMGTKTAPCEALNSPTFYPVTSKRMVIFINLIGIFYAK
jgi:hypothetical protein